MGKLVKAKDKEGTDTVAQRILAMNVDVLAVQIWIDRRTKHAGDGSDHDPAWIEMDL